MASQRGFKQWRLTKTNETITSFEDWRSNMLFTLRQDKDYAPFLKKGVSWSKKKTNPTTRGLAAVEGKTAEQRADDLENMLESIKSFCPVIKKSSIVDNSNAWMMFGRLSDSTTVSTRVGQIFWILRTSSQNQKKGMKIYTKEWLPL